MSCGSHNPHRTERDALDALRWAKKQQGGHGIKYLRVFACGDHWHVGRSIPNRTAREAAPILSAAKLRRKVEAVGANIKAEDRRILAEMNRRAQESARHSAELAALAKDTAETLA